MKKLVWLWVCGWMAVNSFGQKDIISTSSINKRAVDITRMPRDPARLEAEVFAERFGLPVRKVGYGGRIIEIQRIEDGVFPRYNETHNLNAARTVSTDKVWHGSAGGFHLTGNGILVGMWDGALIRTSHREFGSRAYTFDTGMDIDGHPTHVAGTIGASGLNPSSRGMASQCFIEGYDWNSDVAEMRRAASDGLLLSNHSYGYIHGFDYNFELSRWEWYGDVGVDEREDYNFGYYGTDTREWDRAAFDFPYYLILKSAGNDRLEGPPPGTAHHYFEPGRGWLSSTETRDKDGGPAGFDCIGTRATAKNILTVGAINDIPAGYSQPDDVVMTDYSTFGPTDDGRIKPDLVANGEWLISTFDENDSAYNVLEGTSMAAPNVTGSLSLLQELHHRIYGTYLKSATLKGLAIHTADDAGTPGPDYRFGWGLFNTASAASLIAVETSPLLEDSIGNGLERIYSLFAPGDSALRFTLCWTDPVGDLPPLELDPQDLMLVNDLDMRLIRMSDSAVFAPFVLDPADPEAPAVTGDNFRDNLEQIHVPVASRGFYQLRITHKGTLVNNRQAFSLIAEGAGSVYIAGDTTFLDDNNGFLQVTDAPEYPVSQDFNWFLEPVNREPVTLSFTSFSTAPGDTVSVYDGPGREFPLLARFTGDLGNPDTILRSSAGALFITFNANGETGFQGFSARYCTSPPDETPEIRGEEYPCFGSSEVYFFRPRPETDYRWDFSGNMADSAVISPSSALVRITEESFTVSLTPLNRCGAGEPVTRPINALTSVPGIEPVIQGDSVPCLGQTSLYTVENETGVTYWWKLPVGYTGRSDSSSIAVKPDKTTGVIAVIPANSCGEARKIELLVKPRALPEIPLISSDRISPCENAVTAFRTQPAEGVTYRWDAEPGWEIIGPDSLSEVTVHVGEGSSGRVFLTATNQCGDTKTSRNYILSREPVQPILRKQSSPYEGLEELVVRNPDAYELISWYRNDTRIEGYHEPALVIHRNGEYFVEVTNIEGCTNSLESAQKFLVDNAELLYSISTASDGHIRIRNDDTRPARIHAYDLTGRVVYSNDLQPGTTEFRTHRRGLLIFRIEGDESVKSQMIFVH